MTMLQRLSIQKKLLISMAFCLLLFLLISSVLSIMMTSKGIKERVVNQELPAVVGEIRNDILRQIGNPMTIAQGISNNTYLLDWESKGLPDDGVDGWKRYAKNLKDKNHAATVFWVSEASGKYFTEDGLNRTVSKASGNDGWFYSFIDSGKPYSIDIDKDSKANAYMLFINARFEGEGKRGIAGLGLSMESLASTISAYHVGSSGFVFLLRADGSVLMHHDAALADGKHLLRDLPGFNEELSKQLLNKEKFTSAVFSNDSGKQIVASSFVPELNLYVIAQVPEAEVLGNVTKTATIAALVAGVVGGGVGLFIIFLISKAIAAPVAGAARMLGEIADGDGDLSRSMKVESEDEIGALAQAFNRFVKSLNGTISAVRASTDTIAHASSEIAAGNLDLSRRTEDQAASLEQTATQMQVLTSTVRQNADNARQANLLVVTASDVATKGGQVVGDVVQTMGSIKDSSRKIVDIISVIDGIAFQTNILALNAAVEAARAGEQGRGFAVVASEVRSLAQRSASAAKEIKALIDDSVGKVDVGSKLVDEAGATMEQIVTSVRQVADIMSEIAAASIEQSEGIEKVNVAITEMDDATQQNAALVEQAAAAAQSLQDQAASLAKVVSAFKLDEADTPATLVRPSAGIKRVVKAVAPKLTGNVRPAKIKTVATVKSKPVAASANDNEGWEEF